jgi:hypothetical protein
MKNTDKFQKLLDKAWNDPEFRKFLIEHPAKALFSFGIETPRGKKIVIHEDTSTTIHICIPHQPTELSNEDLKNITGGLSQGEVAGIAFEILGGAITTTVVLAVGMSAAYSKLG